MTKRARSVAATGKSSPQDGSFLGDTIECYVCIGRMFGPILSCNEGHSVCEGCYEKLSQPRRCPQCRTSFPPARNRSLEAVVQKYTFACEHGCSCVAGPADIIKHQQKCERAPVKCPMRCNETDDCNEMVSASSLKKHILDAHADAGGGVYHQVAERSGGRFSGACMHAYGGEYTSAGACFTCGGSVQDGVFVAGKVHPGEMWHIRAFHFLKPRKITIKLGEGENQIAFTDSTECIRSLADWDPSIATKAGRADGFFVSQQKLEALKDKESAEEDDDVWVGLEVLFG